MEALILLHHIKASRLPLELGQPFALRWPQGSHPLDMVAAEPRVGDSPVPLAVRLREQINQLRTDSPGLGEVVARFVAGDAISQDVDQDAAHLDVLASARTNQRALS